MIFIERDKKKPEDAWLTKADILTKALINAANEAERNAIIDANESVWTELKDFLLALSNQKCWYSESKDAYNHLHIDHFRPKKVALGLDKKDHGGYWWLAFQWMNYRVCGGAGNVRKKDKFAVYSKKALNNLSALEDEIIYFLDPCDEEDVLKLTFNEHGEASPIVASGWDYDRATYTIESLNLNFKLLKEARKRTWITCFDLISSTQVLMEKNNNEAPSAHRRGQIKEKLRQLKILAHPESEYSATTKACLLSSGLTWAAQITA